MTTSQSGREAFEAWWGCPLQRNEDGTGYTDRETHAAWRAWQAALAQQGREAGKPVAWLCESGDGNVDATPREFVRDDYARFGRKITPLYTATPKQGFPARFFASGPQGCAWFDALPLATAMIAAFDKDDDWTITDTQDAPQQGREVGEPIGWVFQHEETGRMTFCENDGINNAENFAANNRRHVLCGPAYTHPAPKQQAVTEDMVDRALRAFHAEGPFAKGTEFERDSMRAALLAALPGKTEVDRG